jgi:malonyl-CoA O-methyltransferase
MDAEHVRLTYESPTALLRDVIAMGGNPRDDRWGGLVSSRQARALVDALEAQRGGDGRIALTFEVAYGHAWKPSVRTAGEVTISVERLRTQLHRR